MKKKIIQILKFIILKIIKFIKFIIFIIQIIISLVVALEPDPRILGPAIHLDSRSVDLARQPDPLLGAGQQDPTMLALFGSVLGLA